jgi:hypothetical protein
MTRIMISSFVAAAFTAIMLSPAPASAGTMGLTKPAAETALVQEAGWRNRRWWRSNGYETDVNAPTTSVRTNNARTNVRAPFTDVQTNSRGTWVRAPFVNLWVPRD